jgi:raffinose/stachyose/melibiose transport system substrate-binding protein
MNRRSVSLVLRLAALGCFLLPLVTGCAGSSSAQGTLTLRVWYSTDDPVERGWSQTLARQYERSHPHVRVTLTDYSFEDMNTKLQLALTAGKPPDVAYVTPRGPGIPAYLHANRLLNLTSAAKKKDWASALRPGLLTSYNSPFALYGAPKGSVMAVPTVVAAVAVLYNRRLLARLHLPVPRTLAQFESDLTRAKRAGYTPIGIGNGDGWLGDDWYQTLVQSLVPPQALVPEQRLQPHFSFRGPGFLEAARLLKAWADDGYLTPNFGGLDAQEGIDLFFHGATLFQMISSSENLQIAQDEQQTRLPVGVFAFPRKDGGSVMPQSGYLGWVIPAAAQHRGQAIDFIDSLLRPSVGELIRRQGFLPAGASAGRAAGLTRLSSHQTWLNDYLNSLKTAQPGLYIDAAPIANLNATMEANVQLLLQDYEPPSFLLTALEESYATRGAKGSTARIDGEF